MTVTVADPSAFVDAGTGGAFVVAGASAVESVVGAVVTDVVDVDALGELEPQPASASAAVEVSATLTDRNR